MTPRATIPISLIIVWYKRANQSPPIQKSLCLGPFPAACLAGRQGSCGSCWVLGQACSGLFLQCWLALRLGPLEDGASVRKGRALEGTNTSSGKDFPSPRFHRNSAEDKLRLLDKPNHDNTAVQWTEAVNLGLVILLQRLPRRALKLHTMFP